MPPSKASSSWATFSKSSSASPLNDLLAVLTGAGLTMKDALACARKLLPAGYGSETALAGVTEGQLKAAGIADEAERKVLLAIGKRKKNPTTSKSYGKRKRDSDLDRPLPTKEEELEDREEVDLEFYEMTDELAMQQVNVIINRAPVMTAWATIVAERQGFTRQEALSVAHTFTEMNAISKGVAIGIMEKEKAEAGVGPSQPYVDLMGRKVPVISMQNGEWRGLLKGSIAEPHKAFGYVSRAFKQHTSAVMGALRLLGDSFEPDELNAKGYGLYVGFRPESEGWGKKAEMRLSNVLELRKHLTHRPVVATADPDTASPPAEDDAEAEEADYAAGAQGDGAGSPAKKVKREAEVDGGDDVDYDALLDDDLDGVDWDAVGA